MKKTLLLNSDHSPYRIIDWQRAFSEVFIGKYMVLKNYNITVRTAGGLEVFVPAVVISNKPCHTKKLSCKAKNVFLRDNFTCAYCLKRFPTPLLSKDHIHPRSRGGKDDWMNIVTSCKRCNSRKGNKIWEPKIKPWVPKNSVEIHNNIEPEWTYYIGK